MYSKLVWKLCVWRNQPGQCNMDQCDIVHFHTSLLHSPGHDFGCWEAGGLPPLLRFMIFSMSFSASHRACGFSSLSKPFLPATKSMAHSLNPATREAPTFRLAFQAPAGEAGSTLECVGLNPGSRAGSELVTVGCPRGEKCCCFFSLFWVHGFIRPAGFLP